MFGLFTVLVAFVVLSLALIFLITPHAWRSVHVPPGPTRLISKVVADLHTKLIHDKGKQEDATSTADSETEGQAAPETVEYNQDSDSNSHKMVPSPRLIVEA